MLLIVSLLNAPWQSIQIMHLKPRFRFRMNLPPMRAIKNVYQSLPQARLECCNAKPNLN